MIDTYNLDFSMKNVPVSAEISYLAESIFDDEITIQKSKRNNDFTVFDHTIFKKSNNMELCRIRLTWNEDRILKETKK